MGLDALIAALEEKAEAEARARVEAAREQARETREAAERRLRRAVGERTAGREALLRREAEAEMVAARREARGEVMRARADLLERVFVAARDRLSSVARSPRYLSEFLPAHLRQALIYVDDEAIVRCRPELSGRLRELMAGREGLDLEMDPELGPGLVIVSRDERLQVDNTLEGRLTRFRRFVAIEIAGRLEPEGTGE